MATSNVVDSNNSNKLWEYICFEEYDTDSIDMDIFSEHSNCNLLYQLNKSVIYILGI